MLPAAMAEPVQLELQSLRDEILNMSKIISRIQHRLDEVARHSEAQNNIWRARVAELEERNKQFVNSAKWLREQNAELERQVEQQKPDMNNAIIARNAAFRKLRLARMVIRDLVDERVADSIPGKADKETINKSDIENALNEAMSTGEDFPGDSNSEKTIRLSSEQPSHSGHSENQLETEILQQEDVASWEVGSSVADDEQGSPFTEPSIESSSLSVHPLSPSQSLGSREVWKIHYSKPPASAEMSFGPISRARLKKRLNINEETDSLLRSLESSSELCMRLQITGDLAFVYDPVFLEGPSTTCIVDWGTDKTNENIEQYIIRDRGGDPVFHTFVFPVKKNKWFYVGAHTWTVNDSWLVWPTLRGNSRRAVVKKLRDRSHREIDAQGISKCLDNGELSQVCVRISSVSHRERSQVFAREMGYSGRGAE